MTSDIVVDLNNLTKCYSKSNPPAARDISFRIGRGEIFGFVGPNGAGKTTTIKMMLNLVTPTSGKGSIFGFDIIRDTLKIRRNTGFMSSETKLYMNMTGHDLLRFQKRLHKSADDTLMTQLCDQFNVPLQRRIKTYSTGQKQQLALIAALSHKSGLLILDEPTNGLDPTRKREFLELIHQRGKEGAAVIISSHVLSEIESICSTVRFIRQGEMLEPQTIEKARASLSNLIRVSFDEDVEEARLRFPGVVSINKNGAEFTLHLSCDGKDVIRRLTELPIKSLRYRSANLDDLYENLYMDKEGKEA